MVRVALTRMLLPLALMFAASPSQSEPQTSEPMEAARARMWGSGADVRYQQRATDLVFNGDKPWSPFGSADAGTIESGRFLRRDVAVSAPTEVGPCKLYAYVALPAPRVGGALTYLCRPDQPVPYFIMSFEKTSDFDPAQIAGQLGLTEAKYLGVSAPECKVSENPPGIKRNEYCAQKFDFMGANGLFVSSVGSRGDFFYRVSTACAGTQCPGALVGFFGLINSLSFVEAKK